MGLFKEKYYPPPKELGEPVAPESITTFGTSSRAMSTPGPAGVQGTQGPQRSAKSAPADIEMGQVAVGDTLDDDQLASLRNLRRLCKLMDTGITVPIVGYKFGADAIIGMIPYVGDAWGAMVGLYIVSRAIQYQLPKRLVAHMAVNQAVDACVGVVPFLGDLFDFGYKANFRNMQLIEDHLKQPAKAKRADTCFLFGIFFLVVVVPFLLVACIIGGIVVAILAAVGKL